MLKLELKKPAFDFISGLPAKQFRQLMLAVVCLMKTPYPNDAKKLKGYDFHRIDVGEYRVVYRVEGDVLQVPIVGKRNDDEAYRRLKQMGL